MLGEILIHLGLGHLLLRRQLVQEHVAAVQKGRAALARGDKQGVGHHRSDARRSLHLRLRAGC